MSVDGEAWARSRLDVLFPDARVSTELPANLEQVLPYIQVGLISGTDDAVILEIATLSIHAYAATRGETRDLGYAIRDALRASVGVIHVGAVCTRHRTIGLPRWTPYENTNVRRSTGTHQLRLKTA